VTIKKVYIVTSGAYSDYSIEAAFSTEAAAEKFASLFGGLDDACVEEYEVDRPEHISCTKPNFVVIMARNGDVVGDVMAVGPMREPDKGDKPSFVRPILGDWAGKTILHEVVRAKDKQHAVKIVNERRARYIAENMWPVEEAVDV